MDVTAERRLKRQRRIRRQYRSPSPPMPFALAGRPTTERVILPPLFVEEEQEVNYTVAPRAVKTCASLLTDFAEERDPGEYLNTHLQRIMSKHPDFDVYIVVELFYECLDRRVFLDQIMISFRTSPYGNGVEWSVFAKFEFYTVTYLVFFESARIPPENLYLILTEFLWEGARHYYRYLLQEMHDGTELISVIEMVYAPEYMHQKILPNLYAAKPTLRRVINEILLELMGSKPEPVKRCQTVPRPFTFHVTNPKLIDYEVPRPVPFRAGVVPKTQFISPRPSPRYEESLQRNKMKAENLLLEVNALAEKSPVYNSGTKSARYLERIAQVKAEREAEIAKRDPAKMRKIPLEKTFKEPPTRGKETYSDLLRQHQLCVNEELRKQKQIEDLLIGRDENKIRDYIASRNKECNHLDELYKAKLVLNSKLTLQRAVAAPKKMRHLRHERAKQIREEMRLEQLESKEKRHQSLQHAKTAARRLARQEKLACKRARQDLERKRAEIVHEEQQMAAKREARAKWERNKAEHARAEKLLRHKAGASFGPWEAPRSKTCSCPLPHPTYVEAMTPEEVEFRMDNNRREENEKLAARQGNIQSQRYYKDHKIEQLKKDVLECRAANKKGTTVPRRPPPTPNTDMFPNFNPLNQEVESLRTELETLRVQNEITSSEFQAQCRAALKTPEFPSFSSRRQKEKRVYVEIDSSRPSSVSDNATDRSLISSAGEEGFEKQRGMK